MEHLCEQVLISHPWIDCDLHDFEFGSSLVCGNIGGLIRLEQVSMQTVPTASIILADIVVTNRLVDI